ncbi:hypothetical protein HZY91_10450 [Facklamia sp. DSM 111018]|uniref:Sodium:proton antiporter n=1 Tax=Facklamia lactis TaxID=2749967 RepID=A0ABS0LV97_9LACT|nr:monovalent cation/H+ antiporter complex subunit F [Facklamia lactis]MBG9987286.1 hypothetical protein [Facklamia lactis]
MIIQWVGLLILFVISYLIYYIVIHNNMWDQILASNNIMNLIVILILIYAIKEENSSYFDVSIIFSFLSFIGSFFILIYLYRKGDL